MIKLSTAIAGRISTNLNYCLVILMQVSIPQRQLKAFFKGAQYLRIKGLEDNGEDSDLEVPI